MPRIHLHAMCLNEAKMIPWFFRHYSHLVDRFFVYGNGSNDGSLALLAGDERVQVISVTTTGDSFVAFAMELMNETWKRSRGEADWVITAEMDEHFYHPDLRAYLAQCTANGITTVTATGYNMCCESFPFGADVLHEHVRRGVRAPDFDKMAIFDPNAILQTDYGPGRHSARPCGRIVEEPSREVLLLHYKFLGPDYVVDRNATLAKGLRTGDIARRWGEHYLLSPERAESVVRYFLLRARRVPGLHDNSTDARDLSFVDEMLLIERSKLFDPAYYLSRNPDLADENLLEHFCSYGWREGRWPNVCFDPVWYWKIYSTILWSDLNPLIDYIVLGEQSGRCPCPTFDPIMYRHQQGLPPTAEALRHFLHSQSPALAQPETPYTESR